MNTEDIFSMILIHFSFFFISNHLFSILQVKSRHFLKCVLMSSFLVQQFGVKISKLSSLGSLQKAALPETLGVEPPSTFL